MVYAEKVLPHDIEAEEAVIGALLIDGDAIHQVAPVLRPADFYRERNRWCYEAALELSQRPEAIDLATLGHEMARLSRLEEAGGYEYLSQLSATVPTSVNVEYYAQIVQRTSVMRQLVHAASGIANLGYENGSDIAETLTRAEDMLFRLRGTGAGRDFVHIREVLDRYLEESAQITMGPLAQISAPVPTGFADLDQILGGLQRSDLLVLAARPGLGKTALALSIARNAARYSATSAIFSVEMSRDQLGQRLLAAESNVDSYRLRQHLYSEQQEQRIVDSTGVLSDLPIYIDDTPLLSVMDLRSKARRLHLERNVDLIIVDYLQLMQGNDSRGNTNRVQEVSEISRSLKALARDLNVPVLALSQLSRAVENRPTHRPQLSDLRESGSIEQDADVVMFIYREDFNFTQEEWEARYVDKPYPKNIAELIISKHRHGALGSLHLRFEDRLAKFVNMTNRAENS